MRIILHMDMDAYFAAIEELDNPQLRGKPVIIGGRARRGVVSTANYVARRFGVHSAMPIWKAESLCPRGIFLPVRMERYVEISRQIMGLLDSFSPLVEPLSIDEAFLDMTGAEGLFGTPEQMALSVKEKVRETTGLTCSVGVASNMFLAKLASDLNKPDGITLIPFGKERQFIAPLPVRKLWGVGPRTGEQLELYGLRTIGDVAKIGPEWLRQWFGAFGDHIYGLACGEDARAVECDGEQKSIGAERTLSEDIRGREQVQEKLKSLCREVARELRCGGKRAASIRVKIRYSKGFRTTTRDGKLLTACDDSATLYAGVQRLLDRLALDEPIRLVGVTAFDLLEPGRMAQNDLFLQRGVERRSRLEHTMDQIRKKFGDKIGHGDE